VNNSKIENVDLDDHLAKLKANKIKKDKLTL